VQAAIDSPFGELRKLLSGEQVEANQIIAVPCRAEDFSSRVRRERVLAMSCTSLKPEARNLIFFERFVVLNA
jgi:hypothetical protein